jgi:hypothetical protein
MAEARRLRSSELSATVVSFGLGCDLGFALFFISISISALVCGAIGSAHGALEEHLGLFLRPLPIQIMI